MTSLGVCGLRILIAVTCQLMHSQLVALQLLFSPIRLLVLALVIMLNSHHISHTSKIIPFKDARRFCYYWIWSELECISNGFINEDFVGNVIFYWHRIFCGKDGVGTRPLFSTIWYFASLALQSWEITSNHNDSVAEMTSIILWRLTSLFSKQYIKTSKGPF